ncbi:MAG: PIN domain-containing protein [Candidatus Wallbacteria bacterium]|nr:PIN domain-containing protein [Candidatus Wallbacteria bacterium]
MIAVDTNLLVHAHRADSPWHSAAYACLEILGEREWGIPWPCLHEFLAIVTHPRIFSPPSSVEDACKAIDGWLLAPGLRLLAEPDGYWKTLSRVLRFSKVAGPKVHDARIAALCVSHGVSELWSADRDFSRFPQLRIRNPLLPRK